MKTKIFTLLLLAIPFLINAQDLTIASGATVTIGPGAVMVTGTVTNSAGVDGLVIESNATAQGTFIFTGADVDATVQIYAPQATADHHWTFISPMTTNAKAHDFYYGTGNDAWLLGYETGVDTTLAWQPIADTSTLLPLGNGYAYLWITNVPRENVNGIVSFKGPIVGREIDVHFEYNGIPEQSFHLLGNPFTATIHLDSTYPHLEDTYWIWDQTINNYRHASSTHNPSGSTLNGYVAMGQSFFVRSKEVGSSGTADEKFLPAQRRTTTSQFYKKSSAGDDYPSHIMLLASKGAFEDRMYVTFADDGTEDFENGYDRSKLFGGATAPQLYMNVQDRQQSINYIASLNESEERIVPFSFRAGIDGEQTFTFTTQYLVDAKVSLEDTKTGEMIDLMENPVYKFTATPGDNEDRFLLHFNWSPTGIEDPAGASAENMNIYAWDKAVYISNKDNSNYEMAKIFIYDLYGREVYNTKTQLGNTMRIPLNVSNSYLVVRVMKGNKIYTEKVFIK